MIRRLAQGIYDCPRQHPALGILPPKAEEIAKPISEKNGVQIQPSRAYAANLIGLSEQSKMKRFDISVALKSKPHLLPEKRIK